MEINEKYFKWMTLHEQVHHKRDHAMKFSLSWDASLSQQPMIMCFQFELLLTKASVSTPLVRLQFLILNNAFIVYGWMKAFEHYGKSVLMMKINLFYLLNKDVKITVFTTFRNTEEIQMQDIFKLDVANQPVLCSLSIGDFCQTVLLPWWCPQ